MRLPRVFCPIILTAILAACAEQSGLRPSPASAQEIPGASTTAPKPLDIPCLQTSHGCIALNPDVTPTSIEQTICVSRYTKSVRPGTAYTNGVKAKLLHEVGQGPERMADYELDHLIPLAVDEPFPARTVVTSTTTPAPAMPMASPAPTGSHVP